MVRSIDLKFLYDALLGESDLCAKFQLDRITGSGSFFTFVFPPAQDRQREMTTERQRDRDGREVNIRDLKIQSFNGNDDDSRVG